jgi:uncharacterized membrane protein
METQLITGYIWLFIKICAIVGLVLYAVYAAIIVRQEELMSKVLAETSEPILRTIAIAHLIAAVALVFFAIILL